MEKQFNFDAVDQAIREERMLARERIARPRIGDFVRFPSGELERFSHDWNDSLQTSPIKSGSVYLCGSGNGEFSGGLNPAISLDSLTLSDEAMDGEFWFFHHGSAGAGRRVNCSIPCRVYATSAKYEGYLR